MPKHLESPYSMPFFGVFSLKEGFFNCIKSCGNIDPTCGAGEFLLAALNIKFDLWDQSGDISNGDIIRQISNNDLSIAIERMLRGL